MWLVTAILESTVLETCFSNYGPWTSSSNNTWDIKNSNSAF